MRPTSRLALIFLAARIATPSDSIPLITGAWTSIGPSPTIDGGTGYPEPTGGRITCIATDPTDPETLYVGAAGGGVWKSTDAGATWTPLTDAMPSLFMGALAVAPSNPNVIYAGTGEANNGPSKTRAKRYNLYSGRGILKSTDGGQTWKQLGADIFNRRSFSRIVVQPNNENTVYAAVGATASDGLAGNNGVWRSVDGGATWTNVTSKISTTVPVSDLLMDPANPRSLFAAFGAPAGSAVNNVYHSTDAGDTWTAVNLTGTQSRYGRISLAMTGRNVFALIAQASETSNSLWGLYKSTDSGVRWSRLSISVNDKYCPEFGAVSNILAVAGDYHQAVAVDPADPSRVYLAGLCIIGSTDGGQSWTVLGDGEDSGPHHDHHALAFDASGLLLDANDGGIWRLDDPIGIGWTNIVGNMGIAQFNSIAIDPTTPNRAIGGLQDMGAAVFSDDAQWTRSIRGDGGATIIDPTRLERVYQVVEEGPDLFKRSLDGGFDFTYSSEVVPDLTQEDRLWYFPMAADPSNGSHVLIGTYRLWYSSNEGGKWTAITVPNKNGWLTSEVVTALAYAPSAPNSVYAAAGGSIYLTPAITAANPSWVQRRVPDSFEISSIVVNPGDASGLCVSRNTYLSGQVLCSGDSGATWQDISVGLPPAPVLSLAVDFSVTPKVGLCRHDWRRLQFARRRDVAAVWNRPAQHRRYWPRNPSQHSDRRHPRTRHLADLDSVVLCDGDFVAF
jgi:photosystem II stability/assembly factor-like uncharacterized protein